MTWIPPAEEPTTKPIDWNKRIREMVGTGEITEELARKTLGKFLMYNIGFTIFQMTGFIIEPYQRIVIKGWMQKNFSLTIAARSFGKSMLFSHFCWLYCLMNPDHHIIMVSATFRSSRKVVENIDAWSRKKAADGRPGGALLRQCIQGDMMKKQDMYRITFSNGSTVTALPLGDADNLRGFRCTILGLDEGLLIPSNTIELVLKPFLAGDADATKKQMVRRKEDRRIAEGTMQEGERKKFKSASKMIILSSASYKWEELYERYNKYLKIIQKIDTDKIKADETEDGVSSYLVHQLSYKIIKPELMDAAIRREIREGLIPQSVIEREYEARFIDESGGYFSAKEMNECTVKPGTMPYVEIVGDKDAEYVLGIDPSIGASDTDDHFAMCLLKIVTDKDGNRIGMVVHQYACAGVELKHHISYLYYVLSRFNVVYIVCDTTQGDNLDFISICNESETFKSRRMELNPIDAEFAKEDFTETVKMVKRSYNPDTSLRRIVQKQFFAPNIIKAGNDHLRACFDRRKILFASGANSVPNRLQSMAQQDIMAINQSHPAFHEHGTEGASNIYEFIGHQDALIDLVKKECALIEPTLTKSLGHMSYDLPHHMTRSRKNANRPRKDSYSALWLANWGLRIHLAAQEAPKEESDDTFAPVLI